MKDRPSDLDDAVLIAALTDGWGLAVRDPRYRPVGAGAHHWSVAAEVGDLFVTVDDLDARAADRDAAHDRLERAYGAATALRRDAGLDFVVAPVPTRSGRPLHRLGGRYALTLFPQVEGVAGQFGAHHPEDRDEVVAMVATLHGAAPTAAGRVARADLVLPGRDRLHDALDALTVAWSGGPFAEPARDLLSGRAAHLRSLLAEFDRFVAAVRARSGGWVVTHGEPHPGNVIRGASGLHLVDWDTVQVAPPERDLWMLDGESDGATSARYTLLTGRPVDPDALALYRLWWELADIAIYVDELRRPHEATADVTDSWTYLRRYLAPQA